MSAVVCMLWGNNNYPKHFSKSNTGTLHRHDIELPFLLLLIGFISTNYTNLYLKLITKSFRSIFNISNIILLNASNLKQNFPENSFCSHCTSVFVFIVFVKLLHFLAWKPKSILSQFVCSQ